MSANSESSQSPGGYVEHYAQLITHTPEQEQRWREIAVSNPNRVARVLVLETGQRTREGDTQADIYPALQVVKEISLKAARGGDRAPWENLVKGGIAEALCHSVCSMTIKLEAPRPDTPEELLIKVMNELPSPYQRPLEVLCDASISFSNPPTRTDKTVISALKKNWEDITARIWDRPENTLRPEDSHTMERVTLAQMVMRLVVTDPSFVSTLYKPDDLTVQIIARHWRHSQRAADSMLTASILYLLLEPTFRPHLTYVKSNGLDARQSELVSKILLGVGPTVLSSKTQQAKSLITTFAEHLVRPNMNPRSACDQLFFFLAMVNAAKKNDAEPEVLKLVHKSTPLWNAMLRLLKKAAKPFPPVSEPASPSSTEESNSDMEYRMRIIQNIIGILSNTLHEAYLKNPRECEDLIRIWANENIFGALEDTIEIMIKLPGTAMQLTRLLTGMEGTVSKGSPSIKHLFATQFPRWKILGTLIRHDVTKQQAQGGPPGFMKDESSAGVPGHEDDFWDHGAWQVFGMLQFNCVDKAMCGKRGCENVGTILCRCEGVKYCSEACKTKDEKDHGLACGWVGVLENVGIKTSVKDATEPSFPVPEQTTVKKKKKKSKKSRRDEDDDDEPPSLVDAD